MLPVTYEDSRVTDENLRVGLTIAPLRPNGAPMNGELSPRVLLLPSAAVSRQDLAVAAEHAGLSVAVQSIDNRVQFLDELRHSTPSLIVAGPESIPGLELREVLDRARQGQPSTPVIVIGGDASETDSLKIARSGTAEYLPSSSVPLLSSALVRSARARESSAAEMRSQIEMERVAAMLRDNQKLITVGRLAASIAHEINNPLEAVTNLLYLLGEERDLPATSRTYLTMAQRELERVGQISRQTLNFSRETTGPVRTHLDDLMEEVLSLYSRRIAEKNLRVERQYECREEATVYPGEMRQVLSNLITNAVEASSMRGRLRIRVRCSRNWSDPGVRGIRVSVGDNGSGISPAVQRRLGEPFFTTKGQRGTGLGLWVTRSIIQRYGGDIQLRSSVASHRHGTVFSIFLPTNLRPQMVERTPSSGEGFGSPPRLQNIDRTGSPLDHASSIGPRRRIHGT